MTARPKARLVTTAWGETYVTKAIDMMIPALLAPGNLPEMARDFDLEFVIATETASFERILASDAMRRLSRFARPILRPIDDLVDHPAGYGQALTRALHRGFDDLGERMVGAHLMFLNADFIVADGSYANLAKRILAGDRLIFAPSYCTATEQVMPPLLAAKSPMTGALKLAPRDMARLILDFRHMTVRAKTMNRRFMHMHVTDQFYWEVDANTLLGRQMPISLVYMRPEKAYLEPICFWDYAVISGACPTLPRTVIGDSDEFLMLELRKEKTFEELMRIGRQTTAEIAAGLGYMTPDQYEMGRYDLILHAGDLPANVEIERAKLAAYVDDVYRQLPPASSALNHRFWVDQVETARAEKQAKLRRHQDHLYRTELIQAADGMPARAEPQASGAVEGHVKSAGSPPRPAELARRIFDRAFGTVPRVTRLHPYWAELRHPVAAFDEALARNPGPNVLYVRTPGPGNFFDAMVRAAPGTHTFMRPLPMLRHGIPEAAGDFDICVFEFNWMETNEFPRILGRVARRMRPGARAIVHHSGEDIYSMTNATVAGVAPLLPTGMHVDIRFSGSHATLAAQRAFRAAVERNAARPARELRNLMTLVGLAPASYRANAAQAARSAVEISELCMSVTIVVDLPARDGRA